MKMNPMNFMETLGEVRQDYVEEMLNAKANGGVAHERVRGFLMPAFGVLSGAAACAVMVFGIWAVSHPEMMQTVVPAANSAEQSAAASDNAADAQYQVQTIDVTQDGTVVEQYAETDELAEQWAKIDAALDALELIPISESEGRAQIEGFSGSAFSIDHYTEDNVKIDTYRIWNEKLLCIENHLTSEEQWYTDEDGSIAQLRNELLRLHNKDNTAIIAEIKEDTLTAAGCTLLLENIVFFDKTDEFEGGFQYTLIDENGTELPYNDATESYEPIAKFSYWGSYPVEFEFEIEINWEPYYGKLPDGTYTLLVSSGNMQDIVVSFQIG